MTRELLAGLGETFDTRCHLAKLSVAQRQMVTIARALSRRSRLLIMDEPTSSLSSRETEVLFQIVRRVRAEGASVLYISHRLEEVFDLSDRVTVLRDGRCVGTCETTTVDRAGLIRMMVGRHVDEPSSQRYRGAGEDRKIIGGKRVSKEGCSSLSGTCYSQIIPHLRPLRRP